VGALRSPAEAAFLDHGHKQAELVKHGLNVMQKTHHGNHQSALPEIPAEAERGVIQKTEVKQTKGCL
jgi:hypothetical protein